VAIVEDDPDIRRLLELLLNGTPGFHCHGAFESCETALERLSGNPPDLVLMDIGLPGISGIEGVRLFRKALPHLPIIMLTVQEDSESVFRSLCEGAVGYLLKGTPPARLLEALREAHSGGAPMSAPIARMVVASFRKNSENPLTEREKEILALLCEGENYRTIAARLFISTNTVKTHIKNIYEKLHVNSRAEAVSKTWKDRLLD